MSRKGPIHDHSDPVGLLCEPVRTLRSQRNFNLESVFVSINEVAAVADAPTCGILRMRQGLCPVCDAALAAVRHLWVSLYYRTVTESLTGSWSRQEGRRRCRPLTLATLRRHPASALV